MEETTPIPASLTAEPPNAILYSVEAISDQLLENR